jgi:signal transduction histidine kinase
MIRISSIQTHGALAWIIAGVLVVVTGTGVCLGVHSTMMTRTTAAELRLVELQGKSIAARLEKPILSQNIAAIREIVTSSASEFNLKRLRVQVSQGTLADSDPDAIVQDFAGPLQAMSIADADRSSARVTAAGSSVPVLVDGKCVATILIGWSSSESDAQNTYGSLWASVESLDRASLMVLCGVTSTALLLTWIGYRGQRGQLLSLAAIRDAMQSLANGERSGEVLKIDARHGTEAAAWNTLLDEHARALQIAEATRSLQKFGGDGDASITNAIDSCWDGVIVIAPDGRVSYANNMAGLLLGTARDALRGAMARDALPDGLMRSTLADVLASKTRAKVSIDVRMAAGGTSGSGAPASTVLRVAMRSLSAGGAMVMIADVTQQRVADEAKNTFVAQAAHELRTPLTNITLYVEALIESGGHDAAERATALNVINQEAVRLERIVADMLSVSEIEAGGLTLRLDDVRLDAVLDELKRDFAAQAHAKHLTVTFNVPPKIPVIRGDRDRVVLAMQNLVGNAFKYTPDGGHVDISLRVFEEGLANEHVVFDVRDSGIGIAPDEQSLIFDRFYRSRDRRISDIAGTGLGLTLAREVARLHHGDVTVQSELNKGSTFSLRLPKAA